MRIRKSLLLLVLFLGLALLVNLLALIFLAHTITGALPTIGANVEDQLLAVQMQARLRDSEAALYRYLMEGKPGLKSQFRDLLHSFAADVDRYNITVASAQEQLWATDLAETRQQANAIADDLIRLRDAQDFSLLNIEDAEIRLSAFLAHEVRVARPESDAIYQNAVSGMQEYLNEMSLAVASYLASPDAAERVRFDEGVIGFQHHLNVFKSQSNTPQEQFWGEYAGNLFNQIRITGQLLMAGQDRQRQQFATFADMLYQAGDEVLVGQIQPHAAQNLADTQQQLAAAMKLTIGSSLFVAVIASVLAGAVTWPLLRRLDTGIVALTRGADRVAQGDLSAPVNLAGQDELSQLAQAFNVMMTDLDVRERHLTERLSELEALRQVSLQLTGTLDPEQVLDTIASSALRLVAAATVRIFVYNRQQLQFAASATADTVDDRRPRIPREEGIIATAAQTGQPQVINQAQHHPLYTTPRARSWGIKAAAAFPLKKGDRVAGVMGVSLHDRDCFSQDNLRILQLLSDQAAIALENARLYEGLALRETRLRTLAEKLAEVQEEERRLIGLDLHDGLTQLLLSANMHIDTLAAITTDPNPQAQVELRIGQARLREAIKEARWVVSELRPATLEDFGLVSGLRQYASELAEQEQWQLEFVADLERIKLNPTLETAIFRIAQEALTNARKYAHPDRVRVSLHLNRPNLVLEVQDWGRGFNLKEVDKTNGSAHFGLTGMRERAMLLGGDLHIDSRPDEGTRITAYIPLYAVEEK
ncbi:MAG: GAF domain-containing protein [Anaerolineaceae bacterium]|nr:GAF domain-containing protein [Anaerolineaceae bacterium]